MMARPFFRSGCLIGSKVSGVVYGSAAVRSMRTPRLRSAAVGFGPRAATTAAESSFRKISVTPSSSVAAKSAFVPTPVWNTNSFAGFSRSESTSAAIALRSRSGSSASAGAWTGTPPRRATSSASSLPSRVSRIATFRACTRSALFYRVRTRSAREALVGEDQPVDDVAHQRARHVQLRLLAHLLQRLRNEFGDQDVAHRLDGGVAGLLAAADVRHLAEALALVHGIQEARAARHLHLALREEEEALAGVVFLDDDLALGRARPLAGGGELPEIRVREELQHLDLGEREVFLAVGDRARRQHQADHLRELDGELRPGAVALVRALFH